MSEPSVDATTPSFLLDGELPRLGDAPVVASSSGTFAPPAAPTTSHTTGPSPVLSAPGSAPVLASPTLPTLPSPAPVAPAPTPTTTEVPASTDVELPSLPTPAPAAHHTGPTNPAPGTETRSATEHPMAHLMPQASAPSEASRRAAEIRAAKKAKARKVKIGVAAGALLLAAVAGPPVGRWVVDAVNDAGSTSTDVDE